MPGGVRIPGQNTHTAHGATRCEPGTGDAEANTSRVRRLSSHSPRGRAGEGAPPAKRQTRWTTQTYRPTAASPSTDKTSSMHRRRSSAHGERIPPAPTTPRTTTASTSACGSTDRQQTTGSTQQKPQRSAVSGPTSTKTKASTSGWTREGGSARSRITTTPSSQARRGGEAAAATDCRSPGYASHATNPELTTWTDSYTSRQRLPSCGQARWWAPSPSSTQAAPGAPTWRSDHTRGTAGSCLSARE